MRCFTKLGFVLLAAAFLAAPTPARAQFRTFGGGYFGGFGGGYGYGGGYLGGFGAGMPFGSPYGGYGAMPYGGMPFGGGMPMGYPGMGMGYPGMGMGMGIPPVGTVLSPGFGPSETVRKRASLYPAIPEPSRQIIAAALEVPDKSKKTTELPTNEKQIVGKDRARIELLLPNENAVVHIDGQLMKQTGRDRTFETPSLAPNGEYALTVRVAWRDAAGRNKSAQREISFRAGDTKIVDLSDVE